MNAGCVKPTIDLPIASMWIGSPLRGAFRLLSYFLLTVILLPFHLLALALRVTPVVRWLPVCYHRMVCVILGIKVRINGQRSTVTPTLYVCNHMSYLDIEVLGSLIGPRLTHQLLNPLQALGRPEPSEPEPTP